MMIAPPHRHRSLFLSDLHLGARGCRAERILAFLQAHEASDIYLVGDILDLWHPPLPHWTPTHDAILALLWQRMRQGTRLHYLTGNHDAAMRKGRGTRGRRVAILTETVHVAADGRRYLVLHGDICDRRLLRWHGLTRIGSRLDWLLRNLDARLQQLRPPLRPRRRSLIEALLAGVDAALGLGSASEIRLIERARRAGCDGVICGHFHKPALHDRHGLTYANCGDWLDSFTALAEDAHGRLSLLQAAAAPAPAAKFGPHLPLEARA